MRKNQEEMEFWKLTEGELQWHQSNEIMCVQQDQLKYKLNKQIFISQQV